MTSTIKLAQEIIERNRDEADTRQRALYQRGEANLMALTIDGSMAALHQRLDSEGDTDTTSARNVAIMAAEKLSEAEFIALGYDRAKLMMKAQLWRHCESDMLELVKLAPTLSLDELKTVIEMIKADAKSKIARAKESKAIAKQAREKIKAEKLAQQEQVKSEPDTAPDTVICNGKEMLERCFSPLRHGTKQQQNYWPQSGGSKRVFMKEANKRIMRTVRAA